MKTISIEKSHGGMQGVFSHRSEACACDMTFAVFMPPQASSQSCPVVWYLSGLTCTHANVMEKGEYRRLAAELGLFVVCPDTSPRGEGIPDEPGNWQFGCGAGFYVDAAQQPYAANYRMYSYVVDELPRLIQETFPADMARQGIFGHSMGGHGALTIALRNPDRFRSCSAFAPICHPSASGWSKPAYEKYLGTDEAAWRPYDSCALVEDGHRFSEFLIDQGTADSFLVDGLRPNEFERACAAHDLLHLHIHGRPPALARGTVEEVVRTKNGLARRPASRGRRNSMSDIAIHPSVDGSRKGGGGSFAGGTLVCECVKAPVKVKVKSDIAHNHACGCTKCWKPVGAVFSVVAVAPTENIEVTENGDKLAVVDPSALIQRHACKACGVHMYGPVHRDHPFKGLAFIHPERFQEDGWAAPGFAAFVSSIIESGYDPEKMGEVRSRLKQLDLEPYDCLSPGLMDYIATWTAKKNGALPA